MLTKEVSGPTQYDDHGAVFIDTDGHPVLLSHDGVISARPNTSTVGADGKPYVVLVWLKGHNRHVAIRSTWAEFESWRFGFVAPTCSCSSPDEECSRCAGVPS